MNTDGNILVVVHPGSACGSANFNIGATLAQKHRLALCDRLERWLGGVVILDGDLSDELPAYPALKDALDATLARADGSRRLALRLSAGDPDHVEASRHIFKDIDRGVGIVITGAWYHPNDEAGCVNSVAEVLRAMGFEHVDIDESAMPIEETSPTHDELSPAPPVQAKSSRSGPCARTL